MLRDLQTGNDGTIGMKGMKLAFQLWPQGFPGTDEEQVNIRPERVHEARAGASSAQWCREQLLAAVSVGGGHAPLGAVLI
jgi:hypothetical protein